MKTFAAFIILLAGTFCTMLTASAQWQRIPNPFENSETFQRTYNTVRKFHEIFGRVYSQDTIIIYYRANSSDFYCTRTFNRGQIWDTVSLPKIGSGRVDSNFVTLFSEIYPLQKSDTNTVLILSGTSIGLAERRKDTLEVAWSDDYGSNWTHKTIVDKRIRDANMIYVKEGGCLYVCDKSTVYKVTIPEQHPKWETVYRPIGSVAYDTGLQSFNTLYFFAVSDSFLLLEAEEKYGKLNEQGFFLGVTFPYSLYSENGGKTWSAFQAYPTERSRKSVGGTYSAIRKLNDFYFSNYFNSAPVYLANIDDSVGSVIFYADRPFRARPASPVNPDFIKTFFKNKYLDKGKYSEFYLTFGNIDRAYYYNQRDDSALIVFDRYKVEIKIPMPYPFSEASVAYADSDVVYIKVMSGQDSSRKYELFMLKTSDIVGINHEDDAKQGLVVVYPNPADGTLRWNIPDGTATITDAVGRQVLALPASAQQADVSGLAAGVYVLTVRTSAGAVSRTFVKE